MMHARNERQPLRGDVVLLRWPEQEGDARRLDELGRPVLLLVEPGAPPPELHSCTSDWVRLPVDDADVRARLASLTARATRHPLVPLMGDFGELSFRGQRVFLSHVEQRLAAVLVEAFDSAVSETELLQRAWEGAGDPNKVRVRLSRLRKRVAPLGLEISSIRGFGYRLHDAGAGAATSPQ